MIIRKCWVPQQDSTLGDSVSSDVKFNKRAPILPWNIEKKKCDEGAQGKIRGVFRTEALVDGGAQNGFPRIV